MRRPVKSPLRDARGEAIDPGIGKSLCKAAGGGDRQSSGDGRQSKVVLGGSCGLCPTVAPGEREQPSSELACSSTYSHLKSSHLFLSKGGCQTLRSSPNLAASSFCLSGVQSKGMDSEDVTRRSRVVGSKTHHEVSV